MSPVSTARRPSAGDAGDATSNRTISSIAASRPPGPISRPRSSKRPASFWPRKPAPPVMTILMASFAPCLAPDSSDYAAVPFTLPAGSRAKRSDAAMIVRFLLLAALGAALGLTAIQEARAQPTLRPTEDAADCLVDSQIP